MLLMQMLRAASTKKRERGRESGRDNRYIREREREMGETGKKKRDRERDTESNVNNTKLSVSLLSL